MVRVPKTHAVRAQGTLASGRRLRKAEREVKVAFRWALGAAVAIYALGGAAWLYFALLSPDPVPSAADASFVPFVRDFFHHVVALQPVAWALAVAAGELGLAALILFRRTRSAGLLIATVWQVFGAGVADGWPLILINLVIAGFQLGVLRYWLRRPAEPSYLHRVHVPAC